MSDTQDIFDDGEEAHQDRAVYHALTKVLAGSRSIPHPYMVHRPVMDKALLTYRKRRCAGDGERDVQESAAFEDARGHQPALSGTGKGAPT